MVDDPSVVKKYECYCCTNKNVSDQHHIYAIEYGGKRDGKTVPLCPTCHRNVHREGENYYKTKEWGKYINEKTYSSPTYYKRALTLAEYIFQAKLRFNLEGEDKAKESRNMIQVSFTPDELKMTHILKKDLGFTSLEKMIKYLIFDKISQRL